MRRQIVTLQWLRAHHREFGRGVEDVFRTDAQMSERLVRAFRGAGFDYLSAGQVWASNDPTSRVILYDTLAALGYVTE